ERNGLGSHVDVSLMESAMSLVALQYQAAQSEKPVPTFTFEPIRARDGYVMIALVSLKTYLAAYPVIGHPEWATDPAYNSLAGTMKNRAQIMATIAEWAGSRSAEECERTMSVAGVPCSIYRTPAEQLCNEDLIARGAFQALDEG